MPFDSLISGLILEYRVCSGVVLKAAKVVCFLISLGTSRPDVFTVAVSSLELAQVFMLNNKAPNLCCFREVSEQGGFEGGTHQAVARLIG